MSTTVRSARIPQVLRLHPQRHSDKRGVLFEIFKESRNRHLGIDCRFVQAHASTSERNVLRGLHYQQPPMAQAKLVTILRGHIWAVAVDLRPQSSTYLHWEGFDLLSDEHAQLYIPTGFAYGFVVRSVTADIVYMVSQEYSPSHECGIRWDDPLLCIDWGIECPILSERDAVLPLLRSGTPD